MPNNKITVSGAKNNANVKVTGGDEIIGNVSSLPYASPSQSSIEIEISDIDGAIVDVVGHDRLEGANDFKTAISALQEVFSKALDVNQARNAKQALQEIEEEKSKTSPNLEKVKTLTDYIIKLVSVAKLINPASGHVIQIIEFIKGIFHIS